MHAKFLRWVRLALERAAAWEIEKPKLIAEWDEWAMNGGISISTRPWYCDNYERHDWAVEDDGFCSYCGYSELDAE